MEKTMVVKSTRQRRRDRRRGEKRSRRGEKKEVPPLGRWKRSARV